MLTGARQGTNKAPWHRRRTPHWDSHGEMESLTELHLGAHVNCHRIIMWGKPVVFSCTRRHVYALCMSNALSVQWCRVPPKSTPCAPCVSPVWPCACCAHPRWARALPAAGAGACNQGALRRRRPTGDAIDIAKLRMPSQMTRRRFTGAPSACAVWPTVRASHSHRALKPALHEILVDTRHLSHISLPAAHVNRVCSCSAARCQQRVYRSSYYVAAARDRFCNGMGSIREHLGSRR